MEINDVLKIIKDTTGKDPITVTSRSQLPQTPYIYMVYNGRNILQIGKTKSGDNGGRLCHLLKGARPGMHNKSFIVGLGSAALPGKNEYVLFPMIGSKAVDVAEKEIHTKLGLTTNINACVFFDGVLCPTITESNKILWSRYKSSNHYEKLTTREKLVAEDLFKLVDSHKVRVMRKNGPSQPYSSGDILNGNILAGNGLNAFANLWQKITNNYFEYTAYYQLNKNDYETYISNYKSIFDSNLDKGNTFRSGRTPKEAKKVPSQNAGEPILGIDIVILRSQLEAALESMKNTTIQEECKSSDMIFETDNPSYILLVTRPLDGPNKIERLLEKAKDQSEIIFSNLTKTNKIQKKQYFTDVGQCFIEYRANGFKNDGDRYFPQN